MIMLGKDPTTPWISPMPIVKKVDASLKNYTAAFGFEPGSRMRMAGPVMPI